MGQVIDAEIARVWPQQWAKANDARPGASKRRNNLRRRWRYHVELQAFVAAHPNANCGNCGHCAPMPHSSKHTLHCELDSDFYGYQTTSADNVCARWSGRP